MNRLDYICGDCGKKRGAGFLNTQLEETRNVLEIYDIVFSELDITSTAKINDSKANIPSGNQLSHLIELFLLKSESLESLGFAYEELIKIIDSKLELAEQSLLKKTHQ